MTAQGWLLFLSLTCGLLLVLVLYQTGLILRNRRTARILEDAVARFMRGEYKPLPETAGEGPFPLLIAQFNLLSHRMQHHLDSLQREKTAIRDFLYDVSHQFKTPLTTLHIYAEMDAVQSKGEEERERAENFLSLVQRMEWLIQSLLKIAKLESGSAEFRFVEEDLCGTAARAVDMLRERLQSKQIAVRMAVPEEGVYVRHDVQWIGEALHNVLKNAVDQAASGTEIIVTIREGEAIATVAVADEGPGIAPKDLPHLFQRFYRSRNASADAQGCGIGLSLASEIMNRHHGSITAANLPGKGAEFTLTLPRHALNVSYDGSGVKTA